MRQRPCLFVHIPVHKTGSTALQQTLCCNEPWLNDQQVTYLPGFTKDFQHACLAAQLGDGLRSVLELMRQEANGYSVIVSTEQLHLLEDVLISDFIGTLTEVFADHDITFVIYLRRQDDAFSSYYNQIVKFGTTTDTIAQAFSLYSRFFNYERYLDLLQKTMRQTDTLLVRMYDRNTLVNQDIVSDFFSAIGIDHSLEVRLPQLINPSLERSVLKLKHAMNFHLDDAPVDLLQSLAGVLSDVSCGINNGNPDTNALTALERDLIMASYADSNRRMANQYLGGVSFSSDMRPAPSYESSLEIVLPAVLARLSRYFFHIITEPSSGSDGTDNPKS